MTEMFNSSGTLAAAYDYAPFGAVISATGVAVPLNPLTFSSEISDTALGLQYYNYRHLNILDGRWLNRDPFGERGGLNLFIVSLNNSLSRSDYLGFICLIDPQILELQKKLNQVISAYHSTKDCLKRIGSWMPGSTRGGDTSDSYRHCLASCELSNACGDKISNLLGIIKEARDLWAGSIEWIADAILPLHIASEISFILEGGDWQATLDDMNANSNGRKCASSSRGCECCCKGIYPK